MATDLERLVVQLSADVKSYERALQRARGASNREFSAIERRAQQMNRNISNIGKGFGRGLVTPLAGVAAAFSTAEVIAYADAWTIAGNKIKAASTIAGREGRSLEGINDIANDTRSGITETADLYAKLLRSTAGVAQSEAEVAKATVIVNKAFKAGGAAASEQAAGILQLSQALGSGVLQGDELRSLRENAPLLAQAIADEFGVTVAGLKKLGAEGELTTDKVFKAILKAQPQIEAAFNSTNQTIGDSFNKINNQFTKYIGQTDESLGASQRLVAGLNALADNFDETADTALAFASILGAALLGGAIGKMVAKLVVGTGALIDLYNAFRTVGTIGRAALFTRLGAAAGPIGAAIGLAATAALYFATSSDKASASGKRYADVLARLKTEADEAAEKIEETGDKISEQRKNEIAEDLKTATEEAQKAKTAVVDLFDHMLRSVDRSQISPETFKWLEDLRDKLADGKISADDAKQALFNLANSNPDFTNLAKAFQVVLDALGLANKALEEFQTRAKAASGIGVGEDQRAAGFRQISEREASDRERKQFLIDRKAKAAGKYEAWTVIGKTSDGRSIVVNPKEGLSTEITETVADPRGGFMNVPTLFSGKPVPIEEAVDKIIKNGFKDPETGRAIQNFKTVEEAVEAAIARSASLQNDPKFIEAERKFIEASDPELHEKTQEILKAAQEKGVAISESAARIAASVELGAEKLKKGVDKAIDGFVDRTIQAESGGRADARPIDPNTGKRRSSALGYGQFIEETWLRLFREHFPDRAASMSRSAILAMRTDAEASRTLIEAYARQNAETLQAAGLSVDEAALQMAHFLGPSGAIKVLQAAPGTPVANVLSAGAIKANPEVLGGGATVDDVRGYAERRAGMNTVLARENELREKNRDLVADMIEQGQEETARIKLETSLVGASNAEREKEMFIFERLNELKKAGIPLTDDIRRSVEAEANARFAAVSAYDATTAAADRLKEKQEELQAVQQETSYAFQGAMKSFISDLVHGKTATEALYNAVSQLADRLLDIALDQIFKSLFTPSTGAGAGGGLFGALFGGLGFAGGGYTGDGGKYEPKGTVHGGEYVFSKKATSRIGRRNLDAMHAAAKRGYAEGGFVLPRINGVAVRPQSQAAAPNVDARTTVINRFDAASFLSEAMAQPAGAKVILNAIKSQPAAFRAAMQG